MNLLLDPSLNRAPSARFSSRLPLARPVLPLACLALLTPLLLTAASIAFTAPAQQPAASANPLAFDVATIKPTARNDGAWRLQPTSDGYTGMDVSLLKLASEAYGVSDPKLITGGPPWIDRDKFDLQAKFDSAAIPNAKNLTYRQRADMLRPLLADRFHLKIHFESRDFPVYNLVVAKGGPKLKEATAADLTDKGFGNTCLHTRGGAGLIAVQACPANSLIFDLRYPVGRPILDRTGLTGRYSFELHWSPENTPADSPLANYPDIFTALQEQLGLKLEPSTAPLDVLVIDSADHPSAN